MPDSRPLQDYARKQVRIAGRVLEPGVDKGVAALLTTASWVLQRLPGMVQPDRSEVVETLAQSKDLRVMVRCSPTLAVLVFDGQRLLVEIPVRQ
jgi:hypothetical protein